MEKNFCERRQEVVGTETGITYQQSYFTGVFILGEFLTNFWRSLSISELSHTTFSGRLWIHAASKVPEPATIEAMEEFYREIYAVNGITDIKFPDHYPTSRLLSCADIAGCLTCDELVNWNDIPEGVRLEGHTAFVWLCEKPQKLIVPFEMRGFQGVYNLERKIYEAAVRGLSYVTAPLPVKFLLPDPRDPFSLKPGSIASHSNGSTSSDMEKSTSLQAARAAATQFSKNHSSPSTTTHTPDGSYKPVSSRTRNKSCEAHRHDDEMPKNYAATKFGIQHRT